MTPIPFSNEQLDALRVLHRLWGKDRFALIGASAIACFMEMRWRPTYDLDLSLSVSMEEYPAGLDKLSGWARHPRLEHQWTAPGNVQIDIIPAGPKLLEAGEIRWPDSGLRMSLIGLRLAFEKSHSFRLAEDLEIQIAPISVVTVLKMIACRDKPNERTKDLQDLGFIIEGFLAEDDGRRFADEVFELGLQYEETCAFFLGKEISSMVNEAEREKVASFISRVRDEADPNATLIRMVQMGPASWQRDPQILLSRLDAFERGLNS